MGERIYGYHAIEEGLKKAAAGSTLYLMRSGGERLNKLEFRAQSLAERDLTSLSSGLSVQARLP